MGSQLLLHAPRSAAAPLFGVEIVGACPNYRPANALETTSYATGTTGSSVVGQAVVVGT